MIKSFCGEFGLKFTLQSATHYTVADFVRLADLARTIGFKQIWVNDNLGQRNIFVVLSAIAARVPIKIGTSIVVPYFRNPVDIADSLAALSELTGGREVSVGIARGESARAGQQVEMPKPLAMVRETVLALKALLAGQTVSFRDYPVAAAYHQILPEQEFRLAFAPAAPLKFYCGGHGPRVLKFAGAAMDGVFFGDHTIPMVRAGKLDAILNIARAAAEAQSRALHDVCELDIAIARDRRRAYEFARPYAAQVLLRCEEMGFSPEDFRAIGIEPLSIESLKEAFRGGAAFAAAAARLSDSAVKTCFIVGTPEECRDQLAPVLSEAERLNFKQVAFAKLGPDYEEAIPLLMGKVICV